MFSCNLDAVQVFDVGKSQLEAWIQSGAVDNPVYASYPVLAGDYVIVQLTATFGHMRTTPLAFTGYISMLDAVAKMPAQVEFRNPDKPWMVGYATIQEIWHVVDDSELWAAWEHDVAISKVRADGTDFLLYDGPRAVAHYRRALPKVIYSIVTLDEDGETYVGVDYFDCASDFGDGISAGLINGNTLSGISEHTAQELGLYIVNDYDYDEGLAYGLPVLVAYLRVPES